MMKTVLVMLAVLMLLPFGLAATNWVNDPTDCPAKDETNFAGQDCVSLDICGDNSGTAQCYDTSTMNPPVSNSAGSTTNWSSSFNGGYIINCYATVDAGAPFCDNSAAAWCDMNSACYNVHRTTQCNANKWNGDDGGTTCLTCVSGYTYCDGSYTDPDGCEVDIDDTAYPGEPNAHYNSSCNPVCNTNYLDCDEDLGDAGTGCEVHNNTACYVGPLVGVYTGCAGGLGNCVTTKFYFQTGTMVQYGSNTTPFLWGIHFGNADLVNVSNYYAFGDANFVVDKNANLYSTGDINLYRGGDINAHNASFANVSATAYFGDGSNLTGISTSEDTNFQTFADFNFLYWSKFSSDLNVIINNLAISKDTNFSTFTDFNSWYWSKFSSDLNTIIGVLSSDTNFQTFSDFNKWYWGKFDLNGSFYGKQDINAGWYGKQDVNAGWYGKGDINANWVSYIGGAKDVNLNYHDLNVRAIQATAFFGSGAGLTGITANGITSTMDVNNAERLWLYGDLNKHFVPYIGADYDTNLGVYDLRAEDLNSMRLGTVGNAYIGGEIYSAGLTSSNSISGTTITASGTISANATITGLASAGDIYTTGSADDLWLGNATQGSANFKAYATGNVTAQAITATTLGLSSDIWTTGTGADFWLGNATQASASFRAYATGDVNAKAVQATEFFGNKFSGTDCSATGNGSVAFGVGTTASAEGSMAVGSVSNARGSYSFAGGDGSETNADFAFTWGISNYAGGQASVALGEGNLTTNENQILIGIGNTASEVKEVIIGSDITLEGEGAVGIGTTFSNDDEYTVNLGINTVDLQIGRFGINILKHAYFTDDINAENFFSTGYLTTGTNKPYNLAAGDINVNTVYYTALSAKSPVFFRSTDGNYTVFCYTAQFGAGSIMVGEWTEVNPITLEITTHKEANHSACIEKQTSITQYETIWKEYAVEKTRCEDENHSIIGFEEWQSSKLGACYLDCKKAGLLLDKTSGQCARPEPKIETGW